eukprot:TRINITY_DN8044_c0_g1_i1.p1 TRINITY_DN8044_c0_g1~~TRINITY_DN8044_c0_g1_i1.p1  ORF type:complete len:381 (-),score=86.57 TRINITY_DN8044_c0_g1_i1:6-1148(-)
MEPNWTPSEQKSHHSEVQPEPPASSQVTSNLPINDENDGLDDQRVRMDKIILSIIKREEKNSNGVSDLKIKERISECGDPQLAAWALEKIPGPVGNYGYTSLLQKTTEMHLGIRRLLEEGRITKKTKRTYVSVEGKDDIPEGPRKRLMQPQNSEFSDLEQSRPAKRRRIHNLPPPPERWPATLTYLPELESDLPESAEISLQNSAAAFLPEWVHLKEADFNLNGVLGVFASQNIPSGKILGEYSGRLVERQDNGRKKLPRFGSRYEIDSESSGNEFRFLRDNIQNRKANVRFEKVPLGTQWHMMVITTAEIPKDNELIADFSVFDEAAIKEEEEYLVEMPGIFHNTFEMNSHLYFPEIAPKNTSGILLDNNHSQQRNNHL